MTWGLGDRRHLWDHGVAVRRRVRHERVPRLHDPAAPWRFVMPELRAPGRGTDFEAADVRLVGGPPRTVISVRTGGGLRPGRTRPDRR